MQTRLTPRHPLDDIRGELACSHQVPIPRGAAVRAAAAFKDLFNRAEPAGKLYALCGLYITDHQVFEREYPRLVESKETVSTMFGCFANREPISSIVDNKRWLEDDDDGLLDIVGGGYPRLFAAKAQNPEEPRGYPRIFAPRARYRQQPKSSKLAPEPKAREPLSEVEG